MWLVGAFAGGGFGDVGAGARLKLSILSAAFRDDVIPEQAKGKEHEAGERDESEYRFPAGRLKERTEAGDEVAERVEGGEGGEFWSLRVDNRSAWWVEASSVGSRG